MTADFLRELTACYDRYVDTYRDASGELAPMMRLKRVHTGFVVANAKAIAAGEAFGVDTARTCEVAALLHDTGRYEQLRRFNTFRDTDSVDHAVFSHDIVVEKGWLDALPAHERQAVLDAVLWHNRRDVPPCDDALTLAAAHCTRDSDKLDIFRVLEHQVKTTDWHRDCTAFWNLPVAAAPNPEVVRAILAGRPVDYQNIRSLSDFVFIQVGWMVSGLRFATARRLVRERGHLAFRRAFLHELSDSPDVDRICDFAEEQLAR